MAAGGLDDDEEITAINITPMVDIILVLLVIFMVTTTTINEIEGMEVNTSAQMKSSLKAGMQVEVKGGSGSVKAYAAGVDVTGPLVKLN